MQWFKFAIWIPPTCGEGAKLFNFGGIDVNAGSVWAAVCCHGTLFVLQIEKAPRLWSLYCSVLCAGSCAVRLFFANPYDFDLYATVLCAAFTGRIGCDWVSLAFTFGIDQISRNRSEERRVGKESRQRWGRDQQKKETREQRIRA